MEHAPLRRPARQRGATRASPTRPGPPMPHGSKPTNTSRLSWGCPRVQERYDWSHQFPYRIKVFRLPLECLIFLARNCVEDRMNEARWACLPEFRSGWSRSLVRPLSWGRERYSNVGRVCSGLASAGGHSGPGMYPPSGTSDNRYNYGMPGWSYTNHSYQHSASMVADGDNERTLGTNEHTTARQARRAIRSSRQHQKWSRINPTSDKE